MPSLQDNAVCRGTIVVEMPNRRPDRLFDDLSPIFILVIEVGPPRDACIADDNVSGRNAPRFRQASTSPFWRYRLLQTGPFAEGYLLLHAAPVGLPSCRQNNVYTFPGKVRASPTIPASTSYYGSSALSLFSNLYPKAS
jgi:hypothetical protein